MPVKEDGKNEQGQGSRDTLMENREAKEQAAEDNDKNDKDEKPVTFADTLSSPPDKK